MSRKHLNFENAHLDTFKGVRYDVYSRNPGVYKDNLNQVKMSRWTFSKLGCFIAG